MVWTSAVPKLGKQVQAWHALHARARAEIPFPSPVPQAVVGPLGAGFLWAERVDAGPHSLARAPAGGRWSGAETAESSDDDFGSTVGVRRAREW